MTSNICVDPGHGMSNRKIGLYDPGAVHQESDAKFEEATIALQYGLTLRSELSGRGLKVFMTRDDAEDHAPVVQRAANAQKAGCDFFVSIHLNAFEADSAKGVEVLYRATANKALATKLSKALSIASGIKDRGAKLREELAVLSFSGGPALLIELGFIGNDGDREILLNPAMRQNLCRVIADVILA